MQKFAFDHYDVNLVPNLSWTTDMATNSKMRCGLVVWTMQYIDEMEPGWPKKSAIYYMYSFKGSDPVQFAMELIHAKRYNINWVIQKMTGEHLKTINSKKYLVDKEYETRLQSLLSMFHIYICI